MGNILRRFAADCIAANYLVCAGCLYLPYCLPEIDRVGAVKAPLPGDDVHVFRVDGHEKSWRGGGIGDGPGSGLDESHELVRLKSSDGGMIAAQWNIGIGSGAVMGSPVGWHHETTKHTVAVRFYRPGYETIEVKPGAELKELKWKAVADAAGQEKAVDDLIEDRPDLGWGLFTPPMHIHPAAPGRNSPGHREALRFCAQG